MMNLILGFARADSRIRAVLMNGSRVNPRVVPDPFQDFDVACLVTDVEPFRDSNYVVSVFWEVIVVEQPLIGPWPPLDADGSYHNYNIQLVDGNRVDLSFYHVNTLNERLTDSLTEVLIDKDNRIPPLPPPSESSYFIVEPTRTAYEGCCTGFFFALGSHIPKSIWRRQLPVLKFLIEAWLRKPVLMMLEWEIGIRSGWDQSAGHNGKHLHALLTPERWKDYEKTYVGSDFDDIWQSLFCFLKVFTDSANHVAQALGFRFPHQTADQVRVFLEHVRSLPTNATTIY
jgi:aminoglycoside 6-adenylyltransferase